MKRKQYTPDDLLQAANPLLMLLEDIQDPGNLGTILRTGEGAGIDGVIMSRDTADIYNPKTIRSTMGSIYRVPFLYVSSLSDMIAELKQKKITVYAAHLKGKQWYDQADYSCGSAFLIGNEGERPEGRNRGAGRFLHKNTHGRKSGIIKCRNGIRNSDV